MGREPFLIGVVGRKRIGKTTETINQLRQYVHGNPQRGVPGRHALILDANNEFSDPVRFPDIRAIALRDIPRFCARRVPEIRRVAPFHLDGRKYTIEELMKVLRYVLDNFYNGALLVEDINKYVSDAAPNDVIGALCTQAHNGADVILHYQHIGRISPKVWGNLTYLRMHKYTTSVERHYDKVEDIYDVLKIAENLINARFENGDIRKFLHVNVDSEKILGEFEEAEYEKAIEDYIFENYNRVVRPYLNRIKLDGTKAFTPQDAIKTVKNKMLKMYIARKSD